MPRTIRNSSPSTPRRDTIALRSALHRIAALPRFAAQLGIAAVLLAALSISAAKAAALGSAQGSAQSSSGSQPTAPSSPNPAPALHKTRKPLHPILKPAQTPPPVDTTAIQALVAPEPELPHWPANDHPAPARIVWDSHGLRIDAANASLSEILTEISTLTGAHVDGLGTDARVYGQYGPGSARDVLSQLLEGTGYNVIMIGDLGQGAPRQLLLSTRTASGSLPVAHPAPASDDDADVDEPAQAPPITSPMQPPVRAPFNPNALRNPQFPPDMQQRQQGIPGQQPGQQPQQNPPQPNQQ